MGVGDLFVGKRPRATDLIAAALVGLALGALVIGKSATIDWKAIALALLAIDIGSGLISNATEETRRSWREIASPRMRRLFLVGHLTLYPAAVVWLARGDWLLVGVLLAVLLAKVMLFHSGTRAPGER